MWYKLHIKIFHTKYTNYCFIQSTTSPLGVVIFNITVKSLIIVPQPLLVYVTGTLILGRCVVTVMPSSTISRNVKRQDYT